MRGNVVRPRSRRVFFGRQHSNETDRAKLEPAQDGAWQEIANRQYYRGSSLTPDNHHATANLGNASALSKVLTTPRCS